jgi:hypothetical protein
MKKRIIFGLLVGVLLLFFITSSWAVDAKRAKLYGRPEQDLERVPVTPQPTNIYSSMIKLIFIPNDQNLLVFIYIEKSSNQAQIKAEEPVKNSTIQIKEQDE